MKKKALVLAMAACLMAGMVGCSKGKDAKKGEQANPATAAEENKKKDMAAEGENKDANADANMDANADANMDANANANMDANADANMDANADTNADANMDANADTNADANMDANADMKAEKAVTEGIFKSKEADGEFTKARFKGADENDFIAVIGADTELPTEELAEGKMYKVHHDNTSIMTDPQEFTNVTKIEIAE